jgi:hypothetical protein
MTDSLWLGDLERRELTMTTPKIERLIEAVKFFASSDDHQVRPTTSWLMDLSD